MRNRTSSLARFGAHALVGVATFAATLAWQTSAAAAASAVTQLTAQPANGGGALVRWARQTPPADGYLVKTFDTSVSSTMPVGSLVAWGTASVKVSGLTVGRDYRWTVAPVAKSAPDVPLAGATSSNVVKVAADAVPSALASVTAVSRPGHIIEVAWKTATIGQAADFVTLWHWSATGASIRMIQVNADAPPKQFHVGTGGALFLGAAGNSSGSSAFIATPTVTAPAECAAADVCVKVDTVAGSGQNTLAAQGFLNSTRSFDGRTTTDPALASALRPKAWRVGSALHTKDAGAYGAVRSSMISAQWLAATSTARGDGYATLPWSDWNSFRSWVTSTVAYLRATGAAPEYWDLWNEPDLLTCSACNFFSPADRSSATPANVLQTLLVTYQAIKAADPNAKVVAPSLSAYVDAVNAPAGVVNMRTFLAFAAANGMKLDAVSWHENTDNAGAQDATTSPAIASDHLARFRDLVARYPEVGTPAVFLNEYGARSSHLLPGWIVGYMTQIDAGGVAQANRSCWGDECRVPGLDGLLTATGATWQGTTPAYWTHRLYADMGGGTRMSTQSSMVWRLDGTATRHDATSTVRLLLGHHWSCAQAAGNAWCPSTYNPGPATASLNIAWPYAGRTVTVQVSRIAAGTAPIAGPTLVSTTVVNVVGSRVIVPLSGIGDGDAFSVVLKR